MHIEILFEWFFSMKLESFQNHRINLYQKSRSGNVPWPVVVAFSVLLGLLSVLRLWLCCGDSLFNVAPIVSGFFVFGPCFVMQYLVFCNYLTCLNRTQQ